MNLNRNKYILFDDNTHSYMYSRNGTTKPLESVTSVVSKCFREFDADNVISKLLLKNDGCYTGMKREDIKDKWSRMGRLARREGTALHDKIEKFLGEEEVEIAVDDVAMTQFLSWDEENNLDPVSLEDRVYDEVIGIGGTIDAMFQDGEGKYILVDWKRCKRLKKRNRWDKSISPFLPNMEDCNVNRYTLQLNIYRYIIEKNYDIEISEMRIVNFHPDQRGYEEVIVRDLGKEVSELLRNIHLNE